MSIGSKGKFNAQLLGLITTLNMHILLRYGMALRQSFGKLKCTFLMWFFAIEKVKFYLNDFRKNKMMKHLKCGRMNGNQDNSMMFESIH